MPILIKSGGQFRDLSGVKVRSGGAWKDAEVYTRVSGVWQQVSKRSAEITIAGVVASPNVQSLVAAAFGGSVPTGDVDVTINVTGVVYSNSNTVPALNILGFSGTCTLNVSGQVYGKGGNGGATNTNGGPAIRVSAGITDMTVNNTGQIYAGGGGGGGGGAVMGWRSGLPSPSRYVMMGGGGGGGGQGYVTSAGGERTLSLNSDSYAFGAANYGQPGVDGSFSAGGAGGDAATAVSNLSGGRGGNGGGWGLPGQSGTAFSESGVSYGAEHYWSNRTEIRPPDAGGAAGLAIDLTGSTSLVIASGGGWANMRGSVG